MIRPPIGFLATAILATAILNSPVSAQIRATAMAPGTMGIRATSVTSGISVSGTGRSGVDFAGGPTRFHRGHSPGRSAILLPYPPYYTDSRYDSEEAARPQIVVVPSAAPVQPATAAPPLEPLLIEWQGDHFERMTLSQKASTGRQRGPHDSPKIARPPPPPQRRRQ